MDFFEILTQEWAVRALISSVLVGLMCGVLGCFIVLRNMALIGDALAHAILPGVVFAFMLVGYSVLGFFVGSVLAGLATAVGITWIQHNAKTKNDAAIGIVFTAMFSIGVMGISKISQNQGVHLDLKDFLFGNLLGVSNEDIYLTLGVTIYVLVSVVVFYRYLFLTTFQPVIAETMGISVKTMHYFLMMLLSFAVVASLQTVGVILVVAMLITPAATALLLSNRLPYVLAIASFLGVVSALLGFYFSIKFETTPGPAMAVTATAIYLLAVMFSPTKGLVFRNLQRRNLQRKIQQEDALKQAYKLQQRGELSLAKLDGKVEFSKAKLKKHLKSLEVKGLVNRKDMSLTKAGEEEADRLVRAHRLWETYLANKMGLLPEQIHEDAEKYEHLLTEEILDEVDATLGFPALDPHGSPIPTKRGIPLFPLVKLEIAQRAMIAKSQINNQISSQLWELGLLPNTDFEIKELVKDAAIITQNDQEFKIPIDLAKQINIVLN